MTELIIRYAEPSAVMDRAVIPSEVVGTLVRCKDCRYYNPLDEDKPYPCGYGIYMCNKDDYCSYGERREP